MCSVAIRKLSYRVLRRVKADASVSEPSKEYRLVMCFWLVAHDSTCSDREKIVALVLDIVMAFTDNPDACRRAAGWACKQDLDIALCIKHKVGFKVKEVLAASSVKDAVKENVRLLESSLRTKIKSVKSGTS